MCAMTSRKSAVVTVSNWMAGMLVFSVEENDSEATMFNSGTPDRSDGCCWRQSAYVVLSPMFTRHACACVYVLSYRPDVTPEH